MPRPDVAISRVVRTMTTTTTSIVGVDLINERFFVYVRVIDRRRGGYRIKILNTR